MAEASETTGKNSVLADIELVTDLGNSKKTFKQFRPENEIGEEICKDFMKYAYRGKKGFFLSENDKNQIGVMTQTMGLQTLYLLYTYGTNIAPHSDKIRDTLAELIKLTKTDNLSFTASPYLIQERPQDEQEDTWGDAYVSKYVDAVANILTTFSQFRNVLYEVPIADEATTKEFITDLEDGIVKCVRFLNDAAIPSPENYKMTFAIEKQEVINPITGESRIQYLGWNFAPPVNVASKYEPSLYFTYSVTQAYLALKISIDDAVEVYRDKKRANKRISEEQMARLELDDKYLRDSRFLATFWEDFEKFQGICIDTGHYIDRNITSKTLDISEDLIGTGFSKADIASMMNSTTDDALFNTLFCIGILINTGIDLDYLDFSMRTYNDDSRQTDFIEKLQYGLQNIQKILKKFEKENKEYIINQFVLNFNEAIPSELQSQAKVLRKQKISPIFLNPLIIKIFFQISKYLVKYPQKQAVAYLRDILADRFAQKWKWIWDKDGYNIISNNMYVDVLKDFYDYYNEYELAYSGNEDEIDRQKKAEHQKEIDTLMKDSQNKIDKKQSRISELENRVKELEAEAGKVSELEAAIDSRVKIVVESQISTVLAKILSKVKEDNYDLESSELVERFNNAVFSAFFSKNLDDELEEKEISRDVIESTMKKSLQAKAYDYVLGYKALKKE